MNSYQLYEGSIQIPDGWKDQTMNAFMLPESNSKGAKASIVISRDYETKSDTIEHYADLQLVEAAKKLPKYKLLRRSETQISGRAAMQIDYAWATPERVEVRQRQAILQCEDYFLMMTLTTPANDFPKYEGTWAETIKSIVIR